MEKLPILKLFSEMCQVFVDTYLIVLMTLEQICGKHIIVKQKMLIYELHQCIKHLYTDGQLPHLHSCLDEILHTSILRYEQMGFVQVNSYSNNKGSKTNFLMSNAEASKDLTKNLDFLMSVRPFTESQSQTIDDEIANAIMRAQGPGNFAKL